ncbi:MAG: hypothetical protein ACTSQP_12120 [Promethearchaeota archaeon]
MLSSKKRLAVFIIGILIFIIPVVVNQILIIVNSPLNPTNIELFQTETTVKYQYDEGKYKGDSYKLTMEIDTPDDPEKDFTKVTVKLGDATIKFEIDYDTGKYVSGGNKTDKYTFFWIPVKNPMLNAWEFIQDETYDIVDPIGILGAKGASYTLQIGERKVYWDSPPDMDGAQFSFIINIFNENDSKVASGLMDSTCGFLEILDAKDKGYLEIISPGSFAVSRNRYNVLWWGLVCAIAAPIIVFILCKKKNVDDFETKEMTILSAIAGSVIIIDIVIDVWFYSHLGREGMLYLHIGCFIAYALACLYLKYGIKWSIPAFLEVAFVFAMTSFVGDPYVPHFTAFMGLYASYLAMLFRSGIDKQRYDDKFDIIL